MHEQGKVIKPCAREAHISLSREQIEVAVTETEQREASQDFVQVDGVFLRDQLFNYLLASTAVFFKLQVVDLINSVIRTVVILRKFFLYFFF